MAVACIIRVRSRLTVRAEVMSQQLQAMQVDYMLVDQEEV